jgi:hypothetical protein
MKNFAEIDPADRLYFIELVREIRQALRSGPQSEAERLLDGLERQLEERFREYQGQAAAVANANAWAVDILDRQMTMNQELQKQNDEILKQKELIEASAREIEAQGRSVADANVSAVIRLEEAHTSMRRQNAIGLEMERRNARLTEHLENLRKEAAALAAANSQAVFLIEGKDREIAELRKKIDADGSA